MNQTSEPLILYKVDSKGKVRTYSVEVDGDRYRITTGIKDGKQVTSKWTVATPKNVGRANATTAEEQAELEVQARYDKKLAEHYFLTEEEAIEQISSFFKVMLASTPKEDVIYEDMVENQDEGLIIDPKLDGMRMAELTDQRHSRQGKPIPSMDWIEPYLTAFKKLFPTVTLDGEVYNHKYHDDFNALMSLARREHPTDDERTEAKNKLQYHVYDMHDSANPNMTNLERKIWLDTYVKPLEFDFIKVVEWKLVFSQEEYEKARDENLANGYEGSIVRIPSAPYKNGRSKYLIKIKTFFTEEFTIIDILEGVGNASGMAGRVIVKGPSGDIGCGIKGNWDYRKTLLDRRDELIGREATIRFFEKTPDGSLRFPVCIDVERWKYE